jgi:hypothetical protein
MLAKWEPLGSERSRQAGGKEGEMHIDWDANDTSIALFIFLLGLVFFLGYAAGHIWK